MNRQDIPEVQKYVYLGFTDIPAPKFSKSMTKSELNNDQSIMGVVDVSTPP